MNKKGFAISVILYSIIFLIVTIMFMLLGIAKTRYTVNDKLKGKIIDEIDDVIDKITIDSNYTCTITSNSVSYNPELVLSINVSNNKGRLYSFDGINFTSSNTTIVTDAKEYIGYFKDVDGNIGSCSVDITSKTIYRYQDCSNINKIYGEFFLSKDWYSNDCVAVSRQTAINNHYSFYRECSGAGGIHVCGNADGSTCYYRKDFFRNTLGCNWNNETSSWSNWSIDSVTSSYAKRVETATGYKIR